MGSQRKRERETINVSYGFPIFETSASALCGIAGNSHEIHTHIYIYCI